MADALSPETPAAKGNKRLLPILLAGGVLLGALGGAYFIAPRAAAADASKPAKEHGGKEEKKPGETSPVHVIENIVINPAQTGGTRFLMLSIALEVSSPEVESAMKVRDAEVRDTVLRVLSAKSVAELSDITKRDSLKAELLSAVAAKFGNGQVSKLFLPQYVIQ